MSQRVVVIHDSPAAVDAGIDIDPFHAEREQGGWTSIVPEKLRECAADLIVPVAIPITSHVRGLFRWLHDHPITAPTLAVVAADADDEFLRVVSESVDDFLIAPLRA